MKGRYLKLATIETLAASIPSNLKDYTQKDHNFSDLESNTFSFESEKIDVDAGSWAHLRPFESGSNVEAYNSLLVYRSITGISRFQANDPGFWTYLSHTIGLEFLRQRYEKKLENCKSDSERTKTIRQHFFCNRNARDIRRNQGLARLWWGGALVSQFDSVSPEVAADAILSNSDIRASLLSGQTRPE